MEQAIVDFFKDYFISTEIHSDVGSILSIEAREFMQKWGLPTNELLVHASIQLQNLLPFSNLKVSETSVRENMLYYRFFDKVKDTFSTPTATYIIIGVAQGDFRIGLHSSSEEICLIDSPLLHTSVKPQHSVFRVNSNLVTYLSCMMHYIIFLQEQLPIQRRYFEVLQREPSEQRVTDLFVIRKELDDLIESLARKITNTDPQLISLFQTSDDNDNRFWPRHIFDLKAGL